MIVGNDIASYQTVTWSTYSNNTNFVIIKATEGVGFTDSKFTSHRAGARSTNVPLGYYHFCRPDLGNTPAAEANWFCSVIDSNGGIAVGEVIALDFEVTYGDRVNWCKQWLDWVSAHYRGMKPLIYLNQGHMTSNWSSVSSAGYGLWLASYTGSPNINTGNTGSWGSMTMQQWTNAQSVPGISGGVDGDAFFGTLNQFKALGFPLASSASSSPSPTPSRSVSASPSRSVSPSPSPSGAITSPSASRSKSISASPSPSISPSPSPSVPPPPERQIIAVGKKNVDVLTATNPNDFIFHSAYNSLKIVASGIFSVSMQAGSIETHSFLHGLSYTPLVEGFCKVDNQDFAVCPFEGIDAYPYRYYFYYIGADSARVYVKLKNDDGSSHQFRIKFYIFEVPL